MNAVRDIPTAKEIEVRLQSNEVLVHLPSDTPISAVSEAIYEAGYAPDKNLWLQARGRFTESGFLPDGWESPIPIDSRNRGDGSWELHFVSDGEIWTIQSIKPLETITQIQDED